MEYINKNPLITLVSPSSRDELHLGRDGSNNTSLDYPSGVFYCFFPKRPCYLKTTIYFSSIPVLLSWCLFWLVPYNILDVLRPTISPWTQDKAVLHHDHAQWMICPSFLKSCRSISLPAEGFQSTFPVLIAVFTFLLAVIRAPFIIFICSMPQQP